MSETATHRIPYEEHRAITDLMQAHLDAHQGKLRALIAFGELVTTGGTFDIDLLEIVEGWRGNRLAVFSGSKDFRLRGQLRLFILTPEEFENPRVIQETEERIWAANLLERIRRGYEIVLQIPPDYARDVLSGRTAIATLSPPVSGYIQLENPLEFPPKKK
jgi:hypothetical protein